MPKRGSQSYYVMPGESGLPLVGRNSIAEALSRKISMHGDEPKLWRHVIHTKATLGNGFAIISLSARVSVDSVRKALRELGVEFREIRARSGRIGHK